MRKNVQWLVIGLVVLLIQLGAILKDTQLIKNIVGGAGVILFLLALLILFQVANHAIKKIVPLLWKALRWSYRATKNKLVPAFVIWITKRDTITLCAIIVWLIIVVLAVILGDRFGSSRP